MRSVREDFGEVSAGVLEVLARVPAGEAASFCLAQVEGLEPAKAAGLVRLVVALMPAEVWVRALGDRRSDWPAAARDELLHALRELPRGPLRVEALCRVATWLREAELREAFEGVLDGTFPSWGEIDDKRVSYFFNYLTPLPLHYTDAGNWLLHRRLLSVVPDDWKEAWIAHRMRELGSASFKETAARFEIDHWPEGPVRRLWPASQELLGAAESVPLGYILLAPRLPSDLRAEALRTIRACPDEKERLYHLTAFGNELDEGERLAVVRNPFGSDVAGHLSTVRHHLPHVPYDEVRAWLVRAKGLAGAFPRTAALANLAPFLEGADRDEVAALFVREALEGDDWHGALQAPEVLPPGSLAALLDDAVGRESNFFERVPRLLRHLASRPPEVQTLCLEPVFGRFRGFAPPRRVALAHGASRWLAARSEGAFAEQVASALAENPTLLPTADDASDGPPRPAPS